MKKYIIIILITIKNSIALEVITMKKKCIIVTVLSFVLLIALTFILPQEVPLHFGVSGSGPKVNKYFILLFTPVPALIYWAVVRKYAH